MTNAAPDPCPIPSLPRDRTGRFSRVIFPSLKYTSPPTRAAGCLGAPQHGECSGGTGGLPQLR